ncbi:unnamed protein product, partial [Coregonus sp. 'balchen']
MNKIIVDEPQQPSISQFLDTRVGRYSLTHPQQKAISNAILSDLIIDCNFPLSIVENKSFRHFLAVLDSKYTPWNLLKELVDILKPFGEATDLTQGEKVITISAVVPSILSLNHHLEKLKPQVRFLSGLVRGLQASLKKRFLGIFINVKMAQSQEGITAPFSDTVYLKAAALDPAFCLLWIEPHVLVNRDIKAEVAQRVKELILQDAAETEQPVPVPAEEELEDMEGEGLFAAYHKRQKRDVGTPPAVQLSHYIDMAEGQNALLFWALNSKTLPSLFQVAIRVLAVPASSAPVERVFSHGGIILRPH